MVALVSRHRSTLNFLESCFRKHQDYSLSRFCEFSLSPCLMLGLPPAPTSPCPCQPHPLSHNPFSCLREPSLSWAELSLSWAEPSLSWAEPLSHFLLLSEVKQNIVFPSCPAHMPQDAAKFTADQLAYFRGLEFIRFTTFISTAHPHPHPRERNKDCVKCTDKSRALWFGYNKMGRQYFSSSVACSPAIPPE